jgi:hypothetical protein
MKICAVGAPNFMKSRAVGAELFHAERQMDGIQSYRHGEVNSRFSQFANAPKS